MKCSRIIFRELFLQSMFSPEQAACCRGLSSMLAFQILIDGFAISALYALGATGFTLIFGVSGVLNLSHGAIMVAAAVAAWAAASVLHMDPYSGALLGVAVALVAAFATYFAVVKPIQDFAADTE